jgi:hypothetical protein
MNGSACQHRAAIRDIDRPTEADVPATSKPGILTSEFWTTVVTVVGNLLMALTVIGWVNSDDANTLSAAISAMVTAAGALITNGLVIWKYIQGRFLLKQAQLQMASTLASQRPEYRVAAVKLQLQLPVAGVAEIGGQS